MRSKKAIKNIISSLLQQSGGPRMFIKNGENGYLINVNDKEDLKKKIQLILDNTDIQNKISINAKKIINEVRVDTIIDKWKKFIYSVIY